MSTISSQPNALMKHELHEYKELEKKKFTLDVAQKTSLKGDSPGDPPYLMTTETGHKEALKEIFALPTPSNGVYLGFAFEFNYHVLAKREVQKAFICDVNPRMHSLYQWIAQTIVNIPDRKVFLEKFEAELNQHPDYYLRFPATAQETIEHFISHRWSWLYSDANYAQIRQLYCEGKIEHRYLNLTDKTGQFQDLGNWARDNGYIFDIVYLSNIPEWIWNAGYHHIQTMQENLKALLSPSTMLVDAKKERWETGAPKVRMTTDVSKEGFPSFRPPKRGRTSKRDDSSTCSSFNRLAHISNLTWHTEFTDSDSDEKVGSKESLPKRLSLSKIRKIEDSRLTHLRSFSLGTGFKKRLAPPDPLLDSNLFSVSPPTTDDAYSFLVPKESPFAPKQSLQQEKRESKRLKSATNIPHLVQEAVESKKAPLQFCSLLDAEPPTPKDASPQKEQLAEHSNPFLAFLQEGLSDSVEDL